MSEIKLTFNYSIVSCLVVYDLNLKVCKMSSLSGSFATLRFTDLRAVFFFIGRSIDHVMKGHFLMFGFLPHSHGVELKDCKMVVICLYNRFTVSPMLYPVYIRK